MRYTLTMWRNGQVIDICHGDDLDLETWCSTLRWYEDADGDLDPETTIEITSAETADEARRRIADD